MSQRVERDDIPAIATLLVALGARLGQETTRDGRKMPMGEAAWYASLEYQPGPRAANTDPGGGNRWEDATDGSGEKWPVPSDATGETAITHDPTSLTHARYRALLGWMQDNGDDLRRLLSTLLPPQPNTKVINCDGCGSPKAIDIRKPRDLTEIAAAGWCKSCYRDDKHLRQIETRPDGVRFYADYCRWCGGFKADHKTEPPIEVLRVRHRDGQVPTAVIERTCPHCRSEAKKKRKAS